ncbi:MBL fold metallo-hydrolase [Peribacillus sp. SCS-37]|uniref:MBL fold metallo-hydrolase n=1 Tax=Paraperibacillus esterisolvens TaxID=3115296 RepID=UPI003906C730
MKWFQLPLGSLQTNCYVLANSKKECLIFDPGGDAGKLIDFISEKGLEPRAVLLTHAHFDHIGALDDIRREYGIQAYIHEKETDWLIDPALNGSKFFMGGAMRMNPAENVVKGDQKLTVKGFDFELIETPGHSPGSVSYYFKEAGAVFSGDALFRRSIGRTDLPGGNHKQLIQSIKNKLLKLPNSTVVLSGHGDATTIREETRENPFLT